MSSIELRESVEVAVKRQLPEIGLTMPEGLDPNRFIGLVAQAVKSAPKLMDAFATDQGQQSVVLAAHQCASIGLEPNTPLQHCWLLPRKRKQTVECQLQIGYKGFLHLVRNSGNIKTIFAETVKENDLFEYERGLEKDHLRHRAAGTNGKILSAYAVVRYLNGGYDVILLDKYQVEKRRAKSDSFSSKDYRFLSPWVQWEEEMWKKTALKALFHMMPLSVNAATALMSDDATFIAKNGFASPIFEPSDDAISAPPQSRQIETTSAKPVTVTLPPRQDATVVVQPLPIVAEQLDNSNIPEGMRIKDTDSEAIRAAKEKAIANLQGKESEII